MFFWKHKGCFYLLKLQKLLLRRKHADLENFNKDRKWWRKTGSTQAKKNLMRTLEFLYLQQRGVNQTSHRNPSGVRLSTILNALFCQREGDYSQSDTISKLIYLNLPLLIRGVNLWTSCGLEELEWDRGLGSPVKQQYWKQACDEEPNIQNNNLTSRRSKYKDKLTVYPSGDAREGLQKDGRQTGISRLQITEEEFYQPNTSICIFTEQTCTQNKSLFYY